MEGPAFIKKHDSSLGRTVFCFINYNKMSILTKLNLTLASTMCYTIVRRYRTFTKITFLQETFKELF